jgi:hypothetical protein
LHYARRRRKIAQCIVCGIEFRTKGGEGFCSTACRHERAREQSRENSRRYRKADPKKFNERTRRWALNNLEKVCEQKRRYRAVNLEKIRKRMRELNRKYRQTPEQMRLYYKKNREHILELCRRAYYRNLERKREYARLRGAQYAAARDVYRALIGPLRYENTRLAKRVLQQLGETDVNGTS